MSSELGRIRRIHFIGIGGIGMSALARFFIHEGAYVSGSDWEEKDITRMLSSLGANVHTVQHAENITHDIDAVVYTHAMPNDHPELVRARELSIPTYSYPEMLGRVSFGRYTIAVAGTHGKTTTTAMVGAIFSAAGYDPTMLVGSLIRHDDGPTNFVFGNSAYFVVEADEYRRSFLCLRPNILIITNIEADHLDYYTDLADIQSAFRELAQAVPEDGAIIARASDPNTAPVLENVSAHVIDYPHVALRDIELPVPGAHNVSNAYAASVAAEIEGIPDEVIADALRSFKGTWRRFELLGTAQNGAKVYDDYAHHPTEVRATLAAFRETYPDARIVVAFQPHLFSRTKAFLSDFGASLSGADAVIVAPIYAAREEDTGDISAADVAQSIRDEGGTAHTAQSLDEVITLLRNEDTSGAVLVVMGAGNIREAGERMCS